jgi:peptidoglycan/LPS O-acetylase OafA/YrhL
MGLADTDILKIEHGHARISGIASGMGSKHEIPALTGLRFLAAFSVALAHGAWLTLRFDQQPYGLQYWLMQGVVFGMTLFFVLSGFVIHYNYRKLVAEGGWNGLATFIWARFARLYPLFLLVLLIDVVLGPAILNFFLGGPALQDTVRALPFFITLTQSWLYRPIGDHSLIFGILNNVPLTWSISTEWFFYLAYIFLSLLAIGVRRPRSLVFTCVAWCVVWWVVQLMVRRWLPEIDAWAVSVYGPIAGQAQHSQDSYIRWLTYISPYSRIGEFILGMLVAQLFLQVRDRSIGPKEQVAGRVLLAMSIASFPIIIWARTVSSVANVYIVPDFGPAPSVAALIFCVARYNGPVSRLLSGRSLVALGEASYSIYLIHFLIFYIAAGYNQPPLTAEFENVVFLLMRLAFLLFLIFVFSLGLHEYYEAPARRWLRSLWKSNRAVAWAFLGIPPVLALLFSFAPAIYTATSSMEGAGIQIISASYGRNCGALPGNVTKRLQNACNRHADCQYRVDVAVIGDPAAFCLKAFLVEYECLPNRARLSKTLPGEAGLGSLLVLDCSHPDN